MKFLIALITILFISQLSASEKLKLIGEVDIATGEKFKETELGGLSGLFYDSSMKKLYAVSDDKSLINPARLYLFDVNLENNKLEVKPQDMITLTDKDGKNFAKHTVDFEGITKIGEKIYLSSEGSLNRDKPILPEVKEFNLLGKETFTLPIPDKFLPQKDALDKKMGARDNLIFEGLTSTPDGKSIFVGTEEALLQDDQTTTPHHSSRVRIIQYKDLKPVKEILYSLEKVPSIKVADLIVGETGLSDMLAIDENSAYVIERAHLPLAKQFHIKLFKITNIDKAQDVSNLDSVKNKDVKEVEKELIFDFNDIAKDVSPIDNIEGITFGPKLANGNQTLIFVSDNNFNKKQKTQFLAFEIIPSK